MTDIIQNTIDVFSKTLFRSGVLKLFVPTEHFAPKKNFAEHLHEKYFRGSVYFNFF